MNFDIASLSEIGPRRENEDSFVIAKRVGEIRLAIADGLGGHGGGKQASQIAVDAVEKWPHGADISNLPFEAHQQILEAQQTSEFSDMASTLTALFVAKNVLKGVHVGDTRCAVQRGRGIKKLSIAHTEAQRLLDAGKLTKEEFRNYPRRNILDSALGAKEELKVQSFEFVLEPNDIIFLTSDGVHEKLPLQRMLELSVGSADEICSRINEEMVLVGPADNYTCMVAKFLG